MKHPYIKITIAIAMISINVGTGFVQGGASYIKGKITNSIGCAIAGATVTVKSTLGGEEIKS
jgi:hypothetical protein